MPQSIPFKTILFLTFFALLGCQKKDTNPSANRPLTKNSIQYAKGLQIYPYQGYTILKLRNPWPNAQQTLTYVLQEKNTTIPDSLKHHPIVPIPILSIVVTATTHIPPLELLGVHTSLVGFPNTNYISSPKTRKRIDAGKIADLGKSENINIEAVIQAKPSLVVAFATSNSNPSLDNLQRSGLKVVFNADWLEQSPLGRAEWIKFFGAFYGRSRQANAIFAQIEKNYKAALALAKQAKTKPTVLSGDSYLDVFYVPQGQSWAALFLQDAHANYVFRHSPGTGSKPLAFEQVLHQAQHAQYWLAPGNFGSLSQMRSSSPHYSQFDAFKNKRVYTNTLRKGPTGGLVYYELSAMRPDWVLRDLIKIFHPDLLPQHQLFFYHQLQ